MLQTDLRIYRNVYVKGYRKFPVQKLSGRNVLMYTGDVICGVDSKPCQYDDNRDLYISCDCQFQKWSRILKIKTKQNKNVK